MNRQWAKVHLHWLTPEEGGRKNPFIGGQYTPTARISGDAEWFSVVLHFFSTNQPNPRDASLGLLFPDSMDIQARITPGKELEITEGDRIVAHCRVISLEKESDITMKMT